MWNITGSSGQNRCVAVLDIGTNKTIAVIASVDSAGMRIIGFGMSASKGVRKGMVVAIDDVAETIRLTVNQAEEMAGGKIPPVLLGTSGSHIASKNVDGSVIIKKGEVTRDDLERLEEVALTKIEKDKEIMHVLPQEYDVDDAQSCLLNPLGMTGKKLTGYFHVVTGGKSYIANLKRSCRKADICLTGLASAAIASSEAVLSEEEKDQGVVVVDCGAETTGIVCYYKNSIFKTAVIENGINSVIDGVAKNLRSSTAEIKRILFEKDGLSGPDITIRNPGRSCHQTIAREAFIDLFRKQIVIFLRQVNTMAEFSTCRNILFYGAVLTGGGALLPEIHILAELVFKLPVRVGKPMRIAGSTDEMDSPVWSTAIGLLKLADG